MVHSCVSTPPMFPYVRELTKTPSLQKASKIQSLQRHAKTSRGPQKTGQHRFRGGLEYRMSQIYGFHRGFRKGFYFPLMGRFHGGILEGNEGFFGESFFPLKSPPEIPSEISPEISPKNVHRYGQKTEALYRRGAGNCPEDQSMRPPCCEHTPRTRGDLRSILRFHAKQRPNSGHRLDKLMKQAEFWKIRPHRLREKAILTLFAFSFRHTNTVC